MVGTGKKRSSSKPKKYGRFQLAKVAELKPDVRNPRKHTREQIRAIARSMEAFGYNAPILVDKDNQVVCGHGRLEAALLNGYEEVPVVCLDHLTDTQRQAYMLADNKLTDRSSWDDRLLATHLKELSSLSLTFDVDDIGFELPEIDFRIQSLDDDESDKADEYDVAAGPAVSRHHDLWLLDDHRLLCGDARDEAAYHQLFSDEKAAAVYTDPPYNVRIDGHVSGNGAVKHREFAMASGEMSEEVFTDFLSKVMILTANSTAKGAVIYSFMDWRHLSEMSAAGRAAKLLLLNVCVWVKANGGMGSFYRSRHEFVFVFRNGGERHTNNVQLGRHGRNRTTVWNYAGANSFARKGRRRGLELHPTSKPIAMAADAILDCTNRRDIVLDPFIGSGSTILAAERVGRRAYGIELDPMYVDTAIERWQAATKRVVRDVHGKSFAEVKAERLAAADPEAGRTNGS